MENLDIQKIIQKTYYLHSEKDFAHAEQIVRLMPNYAVKSEKKYQIVDYFFETPEKLLEQIDASIRIRIAENKQILSIVCNNDGKRREFETEMQVGENIQDKNEYILFLEDKIQDIYTHKIDVDVACMLKNLKVFLSIVTQRKQLDVINNQGFDSFVNLDRVEYQTKRQNIKDNVFEIKMNCFADVANKTAFERLCKSVEQKILITPMDETKFDAGKRISEYEY